MEEGSIESFREKLDDLYDWPALYKFKFIVPNLQAKEVKGIFETGEMKEKESKNGKYISVSVQIMAQSSQEIIDYYIKAKKIEGIISL